MARARFTWIALVAWPLIAAGQAPDVQEHRAQIGAQREAVEARHREAVQACAREFTQTACTDQARRDRRRELDRLDAELARIDLAERQRRANERANRVEEKQRAAASRAAQPPAAQASRGAAGRVPEAASAPRVRTVEPRAAAASAAAAAASARERARSRRLAEQQAHAEAVRQRNAERAKKRLPAAPLPAAPASTLR